MNITIIRRAIINVACVVAISVAAQAQVPTSLEYNGYLIEKNKPVTGSRTIEAKLYNAKTGGKALATEKIGAVKVANGEFTFQYGSKGIAAKLSAQNSWLAIVVGGKEQSPRTQLLSVPFALRSADAQQLATLAEDFASQLEELTNQLEELKAQVESLSGDDSGDDSMDDDYMDDDYMDDDYMDDASYNY